MDADYLCWHLCVRDAFDGAQENLIAGRIDRDGRGKNLRLIHRAWAPRVGVSGCRKARREDRKIDR